MPPDRISADGDRIYTEGDHADGRFTTSSRETMIAKCGGNDAWGLEVKLKITDVRYSDTGWYHATMTTPGGVKSDRTMLARLQLLDDKEDLDGFCVSAGLLCSPCSCLLLVKHVSAHGGPASYLLTPAHPTPP